MLNHILNKTPTLEDSKSETFTIGVTSTTRQMHQLWTFEKVGYCRYLMYNKKHQGRRLLLKKSGYLKSDKIDQLKTYEYGKDGDLMNNEYIRNNLMWVIKPRFKVLVTNETIFSLDNRLGLTPVKVTREVMNGLEISQTKSVDKFVALSFRVHKCGLKV